MTRAQFQARSATKRTSPKRHYANIANAIKYGAIRVSRYK
jgi:hypothetical protein